MRFRVWDKIVNSYVNEENEIPIQDFWIDYVGNLYYQEPARDGKGYLLRVAKNYLEEFSINFSDKNSTEIYEGDILKIIPFKDAKIDRTQLIGKVEWHTGCFRINLMSIFHILCNLGMIEIIGNIHQNPTLLEN